MSYPYSRNDSRRGSGSGSSHSPHTSYFPPPPPRPHSGTDFYRPYSPFYHTASPYSYENHPYNPPSPRIHWNNPGYDDSRRTDYGTRGRSYSRGFNGLASPSGSSYSRVRRDSQGSPRFSASPVDSFRRFEPSDSWRRHSNPRSESNSPTLRSAYGSTTLQWPSLPSERDKSPDRRSSFGNRSTDSHYRSRRSRSKSLSSTSRSPSPLRRRISRPSGPHDNSSRKNSFLGESFSPRKFMRHGSPSLSRGREPSRNAIDLQEGSLGGQSSVHSRSRSRSRSSSHSQSPSVDSIASSRASTPPPSKELLLDSSPLSAHAEDPPPAIESDNPPIISVSPPHEQDISPDVLLIEEFLIHSSEFIPPSLARVESSTPVHEPPCTDQPIPPRRPHPLGDVAVLPDHPCWEKQVLKSRQSCIDTITVPPLKAGRESKESWRKPVRRPTMKPTARAQDNPDGPPNVNPTEAQTLAEALRLSITTRLIGDEKTREERIQPLLDYNNTMASASHHYDRGPGGSADELLKEVVEGAQVHIITSDAPHVQSALFRQLQAREEDNESHLQELKAEYLSLRESWKKHCAKLDAEMAPRPANTDHPVPHLGRTTRRSAATFGTMGDMARSDLEMEQIMATLDAEGATDPNQLCMRNLATIPDMISSTRGRVDYLYDDDNHLVANPVEYYAPTSGFDDWTPAEERTFQAKYAMFPKQFGLIADFLPGKTSQQCVDYYYLRKKKIVDFRKIVSQLGPNKRRRKGGGKQKGKALIEDIRQHDAAVRLHLDPDSLDNPHMSAPLQMPPLVPGRPRRVKPRMGRDTSKKLAAPPEETSTATATPEPERHSKRKRAPSTAPSPFDSVPRSSSLRPPPSTAGHSDTHSVSTANEDEVETIPPRPPRKRKKRGTISTAVVMIDGGEDG